MKIIERNYAILSGTALIIMAIAAAYSYGYVQNRLIVPGDSNATLMNLKKATDLFERGIIGWFVILMADILVAWSLWKFFTPVNSKVSFATGLVRIIYSIILAFAIYHLVNAWQILHYVNPDALAIANLLGAFEKYWSLGLIVFGFHLMGLGYLSIYSKSTPKWIGLLLYIAGVSYTITHGVKSAIPEASNTIATVELILGIPMAISELGLAIWLILKGGR